MEHSLTNKKPASISSLTNLIKTLRGVNGCPWDKKQTPLSMVSYLVEEVYELADAIESENIEAVCEELGDVLFQVLFIAWLYEEKRSFDIAAAIEKNERKMIKRHPHVFGKEKAASADDVRKRWKEIKLEENSDSPGKSALDSITRKLPALMRSYRISERAGGLGFDWDNVNEVILKVEEEWSEFKSELSNMAKQEKAKEQLALEFGDILFTLVNVARFLKFHPETALSGSTKKFEKRFRYMEQLLKEKGKSFETAARDELEALWEKSKINN